MIPELKVKELELCIRELEAKIFELEETVHILYKSNENLNIRCRSMSQNEQTLLLALNKGKFETVG